VAGIVVLAMVVARFGSVSGDASGCAFVSGVRAAGGAREGGV
jgi:hypothetical protein